MPHPLEAYQCDFCRRCFSRQHWAQRHENACNNNPARRNCKTCAHNVLSQSGIPSCRIHNLPIYDKPYEIDCTRDVSRYDGLDHPVPGSCVHYEYKGKAEWALEKGESKAE